MGEVDNVGVRVEMTLSRAGAGVMGEADGPGVRMGMTLSLVGAGVISEVDYAGVTLGMILGGAGARVALSNVAAYPRTSTCGGCTSFSCVGILDSLDSNSPTACCE